MYFLRFTHVLLREAIDAMEYCPPGNRGCRANMKTWDKESKKWLPRFVTGDRGEEVERKYPQSLRHKYFNVANIIACRALRKAYRQPRDIRHEPLVSLRTHLQATDVSRDRELQLYAGFRQCWLRANAAAVALKDMQALPCRRRITAGLESEPFRRRLDDGPSRADLS